MSVGGSEAARRVNRPRALPCILSCLYCGMHTVRRRRAACLGAVLLGTVRLGGPAVAAAQPDTAAVWSPEVARRTVLRPRVGPRFADRRVGESSGLAASARVPGLLWTLTDSGNEADLFAVAADDGRVLGRVRVAGARNVDWEALALGPCAVAAPGGCLYVGDVGDNAARRASVTVYRVPEPLDAPGDATPVGRAAARRGLAHLPLPRVSAPAESLAVRYPDGPRDVEAMVVLPTGATWLITKAPLRRPDGTPRPALVYEVPAAAWVGAGARGPVTARLVDSLPIVPDRTITHQVTDAALDAARALLAVRTYTAVYLVPVVGGSSGGARWRTDHARRATACDVAVLREPQGEGITVAPGPGLTLVLSSESNFLGRGGLATAGCPAP